MRERPNDRGAQHHLGDAVQGRDAKAADDAHAPSHAGHSIIAFTPDHTVRESWNTTFAPPES